MTIKEALDKRIPRVRRPMWASPTAYLRLPLLFADGVGPWAELYDDDCQLHVLDCRPGSQRICVLLDDEAITDFETYTGPVSSYEQHKENFARTYAEN